MDLRDENDLAHVGPCGPDRAGAFRGLATTFVRSWLSAGSDEPILAAIDQIGADAIRTAADLSRRFGGADDPAPHAERTLEEMRMLVEAVHVAPPSRRFRLFAAVVPSMDARLQAAEPRLALLLDELAAHRHRLAREAIRLHGLIEDLRRSDRAIEDAVHLCRAVEDAFGAASRELERDDTDRALRLRGPLAVRLTERLRDLLTQLVVVRQGRLSLGPIAEAQEALARAIDRTRHTLLAALRTAVAARRSAALDPQPRPNDADGGETELARAVADMRSALDSGSSGRV